MKVNTNLFMEVREYILAEPSVVDMSVSFRATAEENKRKCDTAGCIAGWTCMAVAGVKQDRTIGTIKDALIKIGLRVSGDNEFLQARWQGSTFTVARSKLGITVKEARQLFFFHDPNNAPQYGPERPYDDLTHKLYYLDPGTKEYAAVVVEAIDRFLTNKGYDVPKLVAAYHAELGRKALEQHVGKATPARAKVAAAALQHQTESILEKIIARS